MVHVPAGPLRDGVPPVVPASTRRADGAGDLHASRAGDDLPLEPYCVKYQVCRMVPYCVPVCEPAAAPAERLHWKQAWRTRLACRLSGCACCGN